MKFSFEIISTMMKETKLFSILKNKCPRCHKGRFWNSKSPIQSLMNTADAMNQNCDHCGLKYEREVGFWYGAMYVSYGLSVAIFVTGWVATSVLFPFYFGDQEYSVFTQIAFVVGLIIVFVPFNWWLSRLIWINLFVSYDKKIAE